MNEKNIIEVAAGLGLRVIEARSDFDTCWIETSRYRIPLPTGWTLHAARSPERAFDLLGPANCSIFVRTPRRMPSLESFQGVGQQFHDIGQLDRAAWIEFDYTHDDRVWRQRHELLHRGTTPFVITLQAPVESTAACTAALASVVEQIRI